MGRCFGASRAVARWGKSGFPPHAVSQIVKRLLGEAGLDPSYASPHGLRSGFLTQAALDGAPLPTAMRPLPAPLADPGTEIL